jgi:hypothetical protein
MYQQLEAGKREGKGHIWDALEALFDFKISQRELRENTQPNSNTDKEDVKAREHPAVAAVPSEVSPGVAIEAEG